MPRAFLITHRRYNSVTDGEQRESSPEHKVSLPEAPSSTHAVQPIFCNSRFMDDDHTIDGTNSSNSSDCPDDLYNLTKLAEVSLAAAAGQIYHHRHLSTIPLPQSSPSHHGINSVNHGSDTGIASYAHKLFDRDRDRQGRSNYRYSNEQLSSGQLSVQQKQRVTTGSTGSTSPEPEVAHECPDCGKRYSTSSNLARHRQTHRSLADKKARRCPHCYKVYVSMPAYSMHVRTHVQGCRCPYCGKCFSRPWLLQGHIRTHTGEKPFRCAVCQKAFADKSNLRAHVQTHSDTKPHVCARCGKAFALKSYLYKHEESSCMRGQRSSEHHTSSHSATLPSHHFMHTQIQPQNHPQPQTTPTAAPTPVIVRPSDRPFRSTVISPNPERALICTLERPSVSFIGASRYCLSVSNSSSLITSAPDDEQPVDFSPVRDVTNLVDTVPRESTPEATTSERSTGYAIGLAIAV